MPEFKQIQDEIHKSGSTLDIIRHTCILLFANTTAVKLIDNQLGVSQVRAVNTQ